MTARLSQQPSGFNSTSTRLRFILLPDTLNRDSRKKLAPGGCGLVRDRGELARTGQVLLAIGMIMAGVAVSELPASYYSAMNSMKTQDFLCVKNYEAGASITESYTDFESLDKDTEVVSRSSNNTTGRPASLEAHIDSRVTGNAHLAWQSRDTVRNYAGRHPLISISSEDLTGVFAIEKFLQLWSNSSLENISLDWLPCG